MAGRAPIDRFLEKVEVDENGCWLWTASVVADGYGQFRSGGQGSRMVKAHRFAYEHFVGSVPEGLQLDHLCRVRRCVNPEHLEPVTSRENSMRSDETQASLNARKTHCKRNHLLEGDNLRVTAGGRRVCLTCHRASMARWNDAHVAEMREYRRNWMQRHRARKRDERKARPA